MSKDVIHHWAITGIGGKVDNTAVLYFEKLLIQIIRIYHECEGRREKSVPRDHHLSSLSKTRDDKLCS